MQKASDWRAYLVEVNEKRVVPMWRVDIDMFGAHSVGGNHVMNLQLLIFGIQEITPDTHC